MVSSLHKGRNYFQTVYPQKPFFELLPTSNPLYIAVNTSTATTTIDGLRSETMTLRGVGVVRVQLSEDRENGGGKSGGSDGPYQGYIGDIMVTIGNYSLA